MARYRLVVFDFDGTLADSWPWLMENLAGIAERHRLRKVDPAEIETLRGRPSREVVRHFGVRFWQMPFIARDMRKRVAAAADTIPMFDGVPGLLRDVAAAGAIIAVVTSNGEETVRRVLGPSASLVDHFVCGIAMFGKARKFDRLRRKLGLQRSDVLCVGDEVRDIDAARAAGLAAGAVLWGYANAQALAAAKPDFTFATRDAVRAAVVG